MECSAKTLRPLLDRAFPPNGIDSAHIGRLIRLQEILDREVAPQALEHDATGRYPTASSDAGKAGGASYAE